MLLGDNDMLAGAEVLFEKCSERFPGSFEAKYNLALSRIGLNDYQSAAKTLQTISPKSPRETSALDYLQGKVYAATGKPQQALQSLQNAYRLNPGEENYALDLALLYIRSSAYVPAINVLKPARVRHPDSQELGLELAVSDALAGQQAEAISVCSDLLRQFPDLSTARVIAAFANCLNENYPACEAEASAGLSLPRPNPYLYYLNAEALWNSGSADRAKVLSELGIALEKMPHCSVCLVLRSKVFTAAHDDQAAAADLKAAVKQDAQLASGWYLLSVLYRKTGKSSEAADAIRHYRTLRDSRANSEIESFRKQLLDSFDSESNPDHKFTVNE